jgi:hypothetical protein
MSNKLINLKTIKMSKTSKMIRPIEKVEYLYQYEEYCALHGQIDHSDYLKNYVEPKLKLGSKKSPSLNDLPPLTEVSQEEITDAIESLGKVEYSVGASNGAGGWWYLTFESDLNDNNEYYWFDVHDMNNFYVVKFQHKRYIKDSDGELIVDDTFGLDTIEEYYAHSLDQIIEIHNKVFNK